MKKKMILILVLMTVFCFTNYAFASYSPKLDGKPAAFDPGHIKGYFIWQDENGLHLRITTPGTTHVFSGTIHTDGTFEDTWEKSHNDEDKFHINDARDKITFKFTTSGDTDGIDIQLDEGSYINFNLSLDDENISPERIFIGNDGWHPGNSNFTLRHDQDKGTIKYNENRTVIIIGNPYWWHFHGYWSHGWHRHWHY